MIAISVTSINASRGSIVATSTLAQSTVVLQTTALPTLTGTFEPIHVGPGNQTNPHVNCDLASYTNIDDVFGRSTIHYWDFATGTDSVIPGNDIDLLSDISGGRIAFTEVQEDGDHVIVYDTISQTRTIVPGAGRSNPAIGGNVVALEDRSFLPSPNISEIDIYDLSTGTITRQTNDALVDQNPAVSPTGNAVVWEKCQSSGLGCDVYAATQTSPGVFTTRALTGGGQNRFPSTNGELVVYVSDRSGENDIYYQPPTGGTETHLSIPGNQRDTTISGNLIAFESEAQFGYDIFVYDISTGRLYQVTNTPLDEVISQIFVCNGIGRIVYAVPQFGAFDVYAFTFQVPSSTPSQINDLIALVQSFNLPGGTANSLITKLQAALTAIGASDTATACDSVTAFISECQAQSGKKLTADQADQLITSATQIKADLGCP